MKIVNTVIPAIFALLMSVSVFAQAPSNPWSPNFQGPQMGGYNQGPDYMTPEQLQEMRRQRYAAKMKRWEKMKQQKQAQMADRGMQRQPEPMGKKGQGQHGAMKHGKQHGKHHGKQHQQHRQQMEERLARIESLLQQLLDQNKGAATEQ